MKSLEKGNFEIQDIILSKLNLNIVKFTIIRRELTLYYITLCDLYVANTVL